MRRTQKERDPSIFTNVQTRKKESDIRDEAHEVLAGFFFPSAKSKSNHGCRGVLVQDRDEREVRDKRYDTICLRVATRYININLNSRRSLRSCM